MKASDLFNSALLKNYNGPVAELLEHEKQDFDLVELPSSVIAEMDLKMFQTRPVPNSENIVDIERVETITNMLKDGRSLPAVVLFFYKGKYIAVDGRHRIEAYKLAKSSLFPAFVINKIDEREMRSTGLRLSCLLNDMNGERAGNDELSKNNRKITRDLCVTEIFNLVNAGASQDEILQEALRKWGLNSSGDSRYIRNELAKKTVATKLMEVANTSVKAMQLTSSICNSEMQAVANIIQRIEPSDRIKFAETINAAKKHNLSSDALNSILRSGEKDPVSKINERIQQSVGLNSDNIKMGAVERSTIDAERYIKKIVSDFIKCVCLKTSFYGQEKEQMILELSKCIEFAKEYKNHLEQK